MKRKRFAEMSVFKMLLSLFCVALMAAGCGSNMTSKVEASNDESLKEFSTWTPILNGDKAFKSAGHGGILVKSYLNPIAKAHLDKMEVPYPLPEGSVLAKAVVSSADTSSKDASRVYFMKKEKSGFDSAKGDWSYALAKRVNGTLAFDPSVKPREASCISCHVKFAEYDYVKTVDIYRNQKVL
jgi:hypothetical protein